MAKASKGAASKAAPKNKPAAPDSNLDPQLNGGASEDQSGDDDKKASKGAKGKYVVATEFRDINNFNKVHKVGSDVSHFEVERLKELVRNGHVVHK